MVALVICDTNRNGEKKMKRIKWNIVKDGEIIWKNINTASAEKAVEIFKRNFSKRVNCEEIKAVKA